MKQFIFGGGTGIPTWEDLQHRRQIADALMAKAGQAAPKSWGEGVSAVGQALAGRVMDHRVGKQEEAEKARAAEQFQGIFGGGGMGPVAGAPTGFTGQGMGPASSMGAAPSQQPAPDWSNAPQIDGIDFSLTEQQYGLPSGYLARTAQIESGGDPNAKNPNSSASGLFQFIDSTAQQYGINPMDPAQATDAAGRLAADNAKRLQAVLGRPATSGELYLAHQQGGGGATKLLSNPDALAADLVGTDAVRLNGGDPATMSAREFAGMWTGKFDGGAPAATAGQGMDLARVSQLSELASNPYLPEGQRAVVNALLQQALTPPPPPSQMSPYEQERVRQADERIALDRQRLEQPKPGYRMLSPQEAAQMGLPEGQPFQMSPDGRVSQIGGGGVNVDVSLPGEGPRYEVGTIPQGYRQVYDEQGRPVSQEAIPGGPADLEAQAAGQKSAKQGDLETTGGDSVTVAASRAAAADRSRAITGLAGSAMAFLPGTDNAEVYRQVATLQSMAAAKNLQAMREASPTGGALGNASDADIQLLKEMSGALDPASPNFQRDLADYTRTLLRTIHGVEEGDRQFAAWQQSLDGGNTGGRNAPRTPPAATSPGGEAPDWLLSSDPTTWSEEQMQEAERIWGLR